MAHIEQEVYEEEARQKKEAELKKQQINRAEARRHGPVDDAQMVDEMFDFIDEHGSTEGTAPTLFKVVYVQRYIPWLEYPFRFQLKETVC